MAYIRGPKPKDAGCVFCAMAQGQRAEHVVLRGTHVYAVLNRYPYNTGHIMVIPYQHVPTLEALPPDVLAEMLPTTNILTAALRALYKAPAFNIGVNIGDAAGAGIAEHVHLHIVPRWPADANFIDVIGRTRVIPELLDDTADGLRAALQSLLQRDPLAPD